ncbi:restriction endonuclease [Desulfitobacterium hafniense]|uniref:restriction endonuclease n=1 Tax=Desulfitobacterium hafniense TaxID=49338 RepID=UPI000371D877|nr:restriction endonuclease [Desulfitobacterium hafniense]
MNLDLTIPWDVVLALLPLYSFFIGLILLRNVLRSLGKKLKKTLAKKTHEKKLNKFERNYGKLTMAKVDEMTGKEFELLVEKLIRIVYQDKVIRTETTPNTGDQGCDLLVYLKNEPYKGELLLGVQCKRYKGNVGNKPVQEILGAKAIYGLHLLMAVTNRHFTLGGMKAGLESKVTMIDRDKLQTWIDIYNQKLGKLHGKK